MDNAVFRLLALIEVARADLQRLIRSGAIERKTRGRIFQIEDALAEVEKLARGLSEVRDGKFGRHEYFIVFADLLLLLELLRRLGV